jgi:hypothetical protein
VHELPIDLCGSALVELRSERFVPIERAENAPEALGSKAGAPGAIDVRQNRTTRKEVSQMHKKLVIACMAVAAFAAFAMPSAASAKNTPIVGETINNVFTPLAEGTKIKAVNVGITKMTTSLGTIECTTAELTGTLHRNKTGGVVSKPLPEGGGVTGEITFATFGGTGATQAGAPHTECTTQAFLGGDTTVTPNPATNGLPWCVASDETMVTDEFQVRGGACTSASRAIRFALDVTGIGTCQYQKATAIKGTFTTSDTDSVLTISEQEFSGSGLGNPFGCPGTGKLDMSFTMSTDVVGGASLGITP